MKFSKQIIQILIVAIAVAAAACSGETDQENKNAAQATGQTPASVVTVNTDFRGAAAETIDHVLPRSRGGAHQWDNVVAACARCNHTKGDKTPAELGWRLHVVPAAPKGIAWRVLGHRAPDPRWAEWLDA